MKALTVIFLAYYIIKIFKQKGWLHTSSIGVYKFLPTDLKISEMKNYMDGLSTDDNVEFAKSIFKFTGVLLLYLVFLFIEFIYIIKSTSIQCNKVVVIGYLIFWILIFIKNMIGTKRNRNKTIALTVGEGVNKLNKYSISQMLANLVDVSYFGYMFFALFIK